VETERLEATFDGSMISLSRRMKVSQSALTLMGPIYCVAPMSYWLQAPPVRRQWQVHHSAQVHTAEQWAGATAAKVEAAAGAAQAGTAGQVARVDGMVSPALAAPAAAGAAISAVVAVAVSDYWAKAQMALAEAIATKRVLGVRPVPVARTAAIRSSITAATKAQMAVLVAATAAVAAVVTAVVLVEPVARPQGALFGAQTAHSRQQILETCKCGLILKLWTSHCYIQT
jgi:hypothetical protein